MGSRELAKSNSRQAACVSNPQLAAVVQLHAQPELADYVLQLEPLGLETTKMMLKVLRHVERRYAAQSGQQLSRAELASVLDTLIRDAPTRQRIVQLYEESKAQRAPALLE